MFVSWLFFSVVLAVVSIDGFRDTIISISLPTADLFQILESPDVIKVSTDETLLHVSHSEFQELLRAGKSFREVSDYALPAGYKDLATIDAFLNQTVASNPTIADLIDFAALYGPGTTYEGRGIYGVLLTEDVAKPNSRPNILLDFCHHAREIVTPEIGVELIQKLVTDYFAQTSDVLKTYNVFVIPVVNPDGYNYVWTKDPMWRKNRRPNPDSPQCPGVDLNRNYGKFRFDSDSSIIDIGWKDCGGSTDACSEIYRGSKAFSEAESQTIRGAISALNFAKSLDFHSYGRQVLYPYTECLTMPKPLRDLTIGFARSLSKEASYGIRQPSDDAEHEEYEFKAANSYSFLVETAESFQPPFAEAKAEVQRVMPLIEAFLNTSIPWIGVIRDASSSSPISNVSISVGGIEWKEGEHRQSDSRGVFHLWLPVGTWEVTFSKDGYASNTFKVHYDGASQIKQQVVLKKAK